MPLPTDQRYALHLFYTDYFPGTDRWLMTLRLTYADGLPFSARPIVSWSAMSSEHRLIVVRTSA